MQMPEQQQQQQAVASTTAVKKMKVMVAIDESDESFYTLKWALDNLVAIKGGDIATATATATTTTTGQSSNQDELAMLYLVHVQQPLQNFIYSAGPAVYATSSMAVLESARKAQTENSVVLLSRALHMCKDKMAVRAETLILDGDPKDMICQAVEQMHVDLLVVGSRGLGNIKRAFLGSVSDYCSHHAKCPILIVKPTKESKGFKESRE